MSKKTKTARTSITYNNGLQSQQSTENHLDDIGEQMLTSCSLATSGTDCSPVFRHSGPSYQANSKVECDSLREKDMTRSSNFPSPMAIERDLMRPMISPHHEAIKEASGQLSSAEKQQFSPGNDITSHSSSDRRSKHFAPTASPVLPQNHLLTPSLSFPMTSALSRQVDLEVPKRTKLLHNHIKRGTGGGNIPDGFTLIDSINLASNVPNVANKGSSIKDIEHLTSYGNVIEVKKEPTYRPQVEAISPTGSGDEMSPNDNEAIRHSKDEILQNINRLDRLISSVDQRVNKLRRLKEPLEEKSNQSCHEPMNKPMPAVDLSKLGVAHSIYSENRTKALGSHQFMKASGFELSLPLYQKPSDVRIYHDNILKYASFKPHLIAYIKKRKLFETKRDVYLCKKYDKLSEEWVQRLDRVENNPKKRAKDAKTREIFEKVFPELRRKREEKERMAKMVKKSEVDLNADPEEAEVRVRMGMAAEPPIMLNGLIRRRGFLNENGRIHDNFELSQLLPGIKKYYWTKNECDIFRETYVVHPKNFAHIASQLQNKTIQDCIYFYYITKKEAGYKQLVRRHNMSRRKHDKAKKAHKEVKEEKVEEQEESRDLKFLPSSPVVFPSSLSSSSSLFSSYQFKLPHYLLLPTSSHIETPLISQSRSSSSSPLPPFSMKNSSPFSPPISLSTSYDIGMVKQEPDVKSTPPLALSASSISMSPSLLPSSSLLMSLSSTGILSSVLPICSQQTLTPDSSTSIETSIIVPTSISHPTAFHTSSPISSSLHQSMMSAAPILNVSAATNLPNQQHLNTLPLPLHVGGSIVQGTPVMVSQSSELMNVWQLQLLLQQQFHQQQQQSQEQPRFNSPTLPLARQDLKTLVNQMTTNPSAQETRGSIIKGTPNHVIREPSGSHNHRVSTPSKIKQDQVSPANSHSSPKRPPSGRSKAPSRNENIPLRMESGLIVGEENRFFGHTREILIDDYMTAQKMNSQQKNYSSYGNNFDQTTLKKQNSSNKRKFGSLPSSEGLIYFAGMEVPKGSLCHTPLGNESARSLIDTIISQNIIKCNEEDQSSLKSSGTLGGEGTRPMTPSRGNPNFQSPGTLPAHFFPTSGGSPVAALQSSMMMQPLLPPFFASGPLASIPLLQGPYHPMYSSNVNIGGSEKVSASTGKMERPSFASPPPAQHSPLPPGMSRLSASGSCSLSNSYTSRNGSDGGGKTTPRHSSCASLSNGNNIYNYISSNYNMQIPPLSSAPTASCLSPAFGQLAPAVNSHPSSSIASPMMTLPSSTSPGFHPSASFLQMFSMGQFMTSFPLQMPQQVGTNNSLHRQPAPPSSLFVSQIMQNFHQQLSSGSGMLTAMAGVVPKSTSVTSGHV